MVGKERVGFRFLLGLESLLVGFLEFGGKGDLLEQFDELRRSLACQTLHVSLKDEEIAGLDQDADFAQPGFVFFVEDDGSVDAVIANSCGRNGALKLYRFALGGFVVNRSRGLELLLTGGGVGWSKDQIFHLRAAQVSGLNPQDKTQGVHAVRFARSIGADDGRKALEGADLLQATVRLEILEF